MALGWPDILGIGSIVVVLLVGIITKLYTRRELRDMDGMSPVFLAEEEDLTRLVGKF